MKHMEEVEQEALVAKLVEEEEEMGTGSEGVLLLGLSSHPFSCPAPAVLGEYTTLNQFRRNKTAKIIYLRKECELFVLHWDIFFLIDKLRKMVLSLEIKCIFNDTS